MLLAGCLIVRQNVNNQPSNPTNLGQTDVWTPIQIPTSHARMTIPAELHALQDADGTVEYGGYGTYRITIQSLAKSRIGLEKQIAESYAKFSPPGVIKLRNWDYISSSFQSDQLRVVADSANIVVIIFHDFPDEIIQQVMNGFEFTDPSGTLVNFTNTTFKYTIAYPSNYQIFTTNDDSVDPGVSRIVRIGNGSPTWQISIEVIDLHSGQTFQDYYKEVFMLDQPKDRLVDKIVVGQLLGYARSGDLDAVRIAILDGKGKIIQFRYTDYPSSSEDILDSFNSIMKSFKLL